jgi:penicillin-binding protein 1A
MARRALIDGLVAFRRDKGWRGPLQKIDTAGDWGVALGGVDIPAICSRGAWAS